jgi:hypothetical protein
MVVKIEFMVFWVVAPSALKMEAIQYSEPLVSTRHTTYLLHGAGYYLKS